MSAGVRALPHTSRWRPTPLVAASMVLHGGAALAAMAHLPLWPYAIGALGANHLVLGALGLWPRSTLLGPNIVRLPEASAARHEVALTFDDGPDARITPRVLDLLDEAGQRATFFCIADAARREPALCREIVRRGHAVENHSCGHRSGTFPCLGLGGFRREISAAQNALADIVGDAPRFFRAPAGLRNPLLDPILHELGLRLVSWTRRGFDTSTPDAPLVASRLLKGLAARDILLLHDGHAGAGDREDATVVRALPPLLEALRARGLHSATLRQALQA